MCGFSFRPFTRNRRRRQNEAAASVLALLLTLLALTLPASDAKAVMPAPVTNADHKVGPPVFPASAQQGGVNAATPPSPAPDFTERNNHQRWLLLGLMAGLIGFAVWHRTSRKRPN